MNPGKTQENSTKTENYILDKEKKTETLRPSDKKQQISSPPVTHRSEKGDDRRGSGRRRKLH